jgi:ParB family transcriptional regulator, chromosome partitioning protein
MAQRKGLGKGLDALIPGGKSTPQPTGGAGSAAAGAQQVAVDAIKPNPRQPRVHFKEDELNELAASIREHGVIQPLIVSPNGDGTFILIAGERRWHASQRAGLKTVPVITRQANNQELLEIALIENVQRADLNAMEEAEAYRQLAEDFSLSHEMIAKRVGKSRVAVTNTMRLLHLADAVKQALVDKHHRRSCARIAHALHAKGANLRIADDYESFAQRSSGGGTDPQVDGDKPVKAKKPFRNADVADVEKRLQRSLGTKVALKHGKKGGTVTIYYYSDEELDALLKKMT